MAWSGAATTEKDVMNFLSYLDAPTNLLDLMKLVGTGHFMMASIFA
jgi:hypothetical protein